MLTTTTTNTINTNTITTNTMKTNTNDACLLLLADEEEGAAVVESAVAMEHAQHRALIKRVRTAIEENVEARRVAALRHKFAPRVEAQARAALAAARAATEAARAAAEAARAVA